MVNRIKDIPLSEVTLRKYEKPENLDKRELVRKICLSIGLLQLGDSRDIIVDIMLVLIDSNKKKERLSSEEVRERVIRIRKEHSLDQKGIAESNIRRQLKRLRDSMYLDKSENKYFLIENMMLSELFEKNIEKFVIPPIINRIKEHLYELDRLVKKENDENKIDLQEKDSQKENREKESLT